MEGGMGFDLPPVLSRFFPTTPAAGPGPAEAKPPTSQPPPPRPNDLNANWHPVETHVDTPSAVMLRRTQEAQQGQAVVFGYEDHARQMSVPTPPPDGGAPAGASGGVQLCKRPANLPGNHSLPRSMQLDHHWLKTGTIERGMGPAGGGVPGHNSSPDLPGSPTTVNDHTGESKGPDAQCETLPEEVDPSCVEKELELGRQTGAWTPDNQCQTFAADVVTKCNKGGGKEPEPVDGHPGYEIRK